MASFALDLAAFAEKTGKRADLVMRKVAIDLLGSVVKRSPVGNPDTWKSPAPPGYSGGRFRANWQMSIGRAATGQMDKIDKDGDATVAAGQAVLVNFNVGPSIYITNNLPYGPRLEYEGWSNQAPAGMVRITVREFRSFIEKAVRELP